MSNFHTKLSCGLGSKHSLKHFILVLWFKTKPEAGYQLHVPVFLPTSEAEIWRITIPGQLRQKVLETPPQPISGP
jgi:hypothetical protein